MPTLAERIDQARVDERLAAAHDVWQVREDQVRAAGQFGSVYQDELSQQRRSYLSLVPDTVHAVAQLELDLPAYSERAEIRRRLADKIKREVLPIFCPRWLERYPEKLRSARQTGCFGVRRDTGRPIVFWDEKAGLTRLCPDDAREEAQRLHRRCEPPLREWVDRSRAHRITYSVFTMPNSTPAHLRHGMQAIFRRFKRVVLKSGEFPAIKGALCVLEAPLGHARDWNVHLNVLLMHDGFVDWGKLRRLWHWNVHCQQLSREPDAIRNALRELIKYAAAATVSKSAEKYAYGTQTETADESRAERDSRSAASILLLGGESQLPESPGAGTRPDSGDVRSPSTQAGRGPAPPMLEWTGPELAEWLEAFHGFRRTRTYGVLYRLPKPEPDVGPIVWIGRVRFERGRYVHHVPLLDSIPEDKSYPLSALDRYKKLCWQMRPPPNSNFRGPFPRAADLDENFAAHYAQKT